MCVSMVPLGFRNPLPLVPAPGCSLSSSSSSFSSTLRSPYRHQNRVNSRARTVSTLARKSPGDSGGGYAEQQYMPPTDPRLGPPPDLPSLLLHNRIVYVGMALVPAVTELVRRSLASFISDSSYTHFWVLGKVLTCSLFLYCFLEWQIIAELLYLNYESQDRPIYMYINSPGISAPDGRAIGFDTEAFAIADVMQYIRAPVATVCVGQCYGSAAMLLARYVCMNTTFFFLFSFPHYYSSYWAARFEMP